MHWPAVRFNALVEEALHANPDVSAAQAALRQTNERVFADQASLFMVPAMYMFIGATHQQDVVRPQALH